MTETPRSASADSAHDRLVLQPYTTEGALGLSSLVGGGVEFVPTDASHGETLAAIRRAGYLVLCDPLVHSEATCSDPGDWRIIDQLGDLRVAFAKVAWTTRRHATTIGQLRTIQARHCYWRTDGWGSCEVSIDLPGSVPTSGLVVIESPDDHPLLPALSRRLGFGDPIRLASDPAEVERRLSFLGRQLSATRCAMVHDVVTERPHALNELIVETLSNFQLVRTSISLDA